MRLKKQAVLTGVLAAAFVVGCNKSDSTTPAATAPSVSSGTPASTAAPVAGSPAAVTAISELAGTYHAMSEIQNQPAARRHQTLTLKSDGTAELDTTLTKTAAASPESSDTSAGTYTAGPKQITVTFTTKDGKPLPASDTMRVLKLTREAGDKALMSEDGRTFERAK